MAERSKVWAPVTQTQLGVWEAMIMLAIGCAIGLVAGWLLALGVGSAHAGGTGVLTWNQPADCASVTGWDLLAAPITAAQPNPQPTHATVQTTISNGPPVICGPTATRTTLVSGVGPTRFWLRARNGLVTSGESNAVDVSLPLARPASLTLVVP